jgi:DNA-binding beta-propeller fold protein YncE
MRANGHSLRCAGLIGGIVAALAMLPAPAVAASRIYWAWATLTSNTATVGGIASANLLGGNGQNLSISGAVLDHPLGVAIDSGTGKMYWANFGSSINYCTGALRGGNTISFANLDGTGGGFLNTNGATVSGPDGLAIDAAAGRLYWANDHANSISYANLDGSGGNNLNINSATLNCPAGVAVDPAGGRVYWTNFVGNTIGYAKLDGSGSGILPTTGASMSGPYGLAIDRADGRLYWANNTGNSISYANLDGSGGDDLVHAGATVAGPWGVAIDPAAGRIYWANNTGNSIS